MKVTTIAFDKAVKVKIIAQNSHRQGRPKLRRKMVEIAKVESSIKQKYMESTDSYVGFYTRITLYKGIGNYYLQISGISQDQTNFPSKNKIITFDNPEDFAEIASNPEDKRLFWSNLTEALIDYTLESEYLTDFEKERWELVMVDG